MSGMCTRCNGLLRRRGAPSTESVTSRDPGTTRALVPTPAPLGRSRPLRFGLQHRRRRPLTAATGVGIRESVRPATPTARAVARLDSRRARGQRWRWPAASRLLRRPARQLHDDGVRSFGGCSVQSPVSPSFRLVRHPLPARSDPARTAAGCCSPGSRRRLGPPAPCSPRAERLIAGHARRRPWPGPVAG